MKPFLDSSDDIFCEAGIVRLIKGQSNYLKTTVYMALTEEN